LDKGYHPVTDSRHRLYGGVTGIPVDCDPADNLFQPVFGRIVTYPTIGTYCDPTISGIVS